MLGIGALVYAIGPEFIDHMPSFYNFLKEGLENFNEYKVCSASVRVVGDICRALDYKLLSFSEDIMEVLLKILCRMGVHRSVKPPLFSCFGDMALAIGIHFEEYVPYVVPLMKDAANECAHIDGEYGNRLKRSIFEAYSSILQGCKRSKAEIMKPYVPDLLKFMQDAVKEPNRDESVVGAAVAVLGDLADALALSPNVKMFIEYLPFCSEFLGECVLSEDEQLKKTATRTLKMIDKMSSLYRTQDEDQDKKDNIPNLAVAVGTVARTSVLKNISKPDWLSCAAGKWSYLESVSVKQLSEMVDFGLECLLNAMRDKNIHAKDSASWTFSCILKLLDTPATGLPVILPKHREIIPVLLVSIKDSPAVAVKVCGVIYHLAQGYGCLETSSSVLAPYLKDIITSLIAAAERTDASYAKLRSAAYETLQEVVRCSDVESVQEIRPFLTVFINKLAQTIKRPILSSEDREKQLDLLSLICGVMQVIIQKLSCTNETKQIISEAADQIMMLLFKEFNCRRSTVYEKAMLAIGALACATGPKFVQYIPEFCKYLEMGLENFKEYKASSISIGVVSDICRALDYKVLRFRDIMPLLLRKLYTEDQHWSVKSQLFSCFGDMALAIGIYFEDYVSYVVPMIEEAADECSQIDVNDEEMEYGNQLRRSIFEAYSGILQGCKRSKTEIMEPYVPRLLKFIKVVVKDANRDESVVGAAVSVLGDLADALALWPNPKVKMFKEHLPFCSEFLGECLQSECEQLKATATRTREMIDKISSICG